MIRFSSFAFLACITLLAACKGEGISRAEAAKLDNRAKRVESRIAKASEGDTDAPVAKWIMPTELREISGLAVTPDGRLLAHDDEISRVYEIDPKKGVIIKSFTLGNGLKGDFEGITVAGQDIYMILSNGLLYRFREGANSSRVEFTTHDTKLGKECEFEGVAYEKDSARLVMPCKQAKGKKFDEEVVIYRWKIGSKDSSGLTMMTVPLSEVVAANKWKKFRPSDITIDPMTGNYVIISSLEKALVVMTPDGDVLRSEDLPGKHHQAEGVAITSDDLLIISDEATSQPSAITIYKWRRDDAGSQ